MTASVAIVGAGPTGTSLLERLVASAADLLGGRDLVVHLVDPHPPGGGRVWRAGQSHLLRMNSMAEDVTMFTDDSVTCEGPIRPGPSLAEWLRLDDDTADGRSFPTRLVQSAYLGWVLDRAVADGAPSVRVEVHQAAAVDLGQRDDGTQVVHLDGGGVVEADVVLLAQGHVDVEPDDEQAALAAFAGRHGLAYLPPAYTADADLDAFAPGSPVVLRGTGLAFVDLVVLLTEGRGGRFHRDGDGLRYEPSGREPLLYTGSRRGLPYRSKLGYRRPGPPLPLPRFLTREAIAAAVGAGPAEVRRDLWPLLARELTWAHHHQLAHAHPERLAAPWDQVDAVLATHDHDDPGLAAYLRAVVPDPADRLDLDELDRPLDGLGPLSLDELQRVVADRVAADLARKADPARSADAAVFDAFLHCVLSVLRSGASDPGGWWFGLFSTYASGPPPFRLEELLALARAGVVRFLGAGIDVRADEGAGRFVATSATLDGEVAAAGLIEARLPTPLLTRTTDRLLRALRDRGEVTADEAGRLRVDADGLRTVDRHGTPHPRRSAVGVHTSRPAAGAFARPSTNAPSFRQHDAVARRALRVLADLHAPVPA